MSAASASAAKGHDVPNLLRAAWGRDTAKRAALAANVPHETARNWLRGRARPLAETLLRMAERDEAMAAALSTRLDALRADRAASRAGKASQVDGDEVKWWASATS